MPELPEVETIANSLRHGTRENLTLAGKRVTGARLLWERTLAVPGPDEFVARVSGQVVQDIGRRGKFLLLHLSSDDTLLFHLRMSGDILLTRDEGPLAAHDRLVLYFEDGLRLAFNDTRKFGRVWLVSDPLSVLGQLGPEPLDPNFTPEDLYHRLQSCRRQIKPLLLDQTFLAGLGNIYTDEALHLAGIHPLANSQAISYAGAERLWKSIQDVLKEGIRLSGASIDWVYRGGEFQNHFRVYQRAGQPCPVCHTPIQRMAVGQRGTHFCPVCQPDPQEKDLQ